MSKIPTRGPLDDSVKLGIPSVTTDPESLRRATIALTRAMEELARQRGDVGRSAVRVNDLVKLGLVSPDIIHTLDPGGAVYLQRGASGFIPQPPAPAPPGEPSEPTEPAEHGHSWNDIANLPDCFDPCLHTHSWEDIRNPPPSGDFDPECCGVPIRRCPEGLGNEPFWECSDNLTQLADLDCCGFIVRDCSAIAGEVCTIIPLEPVALFSAPAFSEVPVAAAISRGSIYEDENGILWQQALFTVSTAQPAADFSGFYKMGLRSIDPTTGSVLSYEEVLAPKTAGGWTDYVFPLHNTKKTQLVLANGPTNWNLRWVVNGVNSAEVDQNTICAPSGHTFNSATECVTSFTNNPPIYHIPNVGVYVTYNKTSEPTSRGIARYQSNGVDVEPGVAVLNQVNTVAAAGGLFSIIGHDEQNQLYVYHSGPSQLVCYTSELAEVWRVNVPDGADFPPAPDAGTITPRAVFRDGTFLVAYGSGDPISNTHTRFFDITDPNNWVYLDALQLSNGASGNYVAYNQCDGFGLAASAAITVCNIDCVQVPGDPVFTCREITVAGDPGFERLTVVNGDAQVGNPVIDLATVEQAVNGNLVAVDIDAWGRVVGNRAVVTADLPPLVESEASYQFLLADNTPYKKFVYAAGALSAINLYTDAGLTDHRYTKTFNYTGSQLTSITLTRISDSAEWYKTLTYNVDDTIDLVSSAA